MSTLKDIVIGLSISVILGGGGIAIFEYVKKRKLTSPVKSILFIGDSNTAANFSYADQLQKMYPSLVIKKIAEPSQKTDWMLQQLTAELAKNKYDIVAILGGSNDIYATAAIDGAEKNLAAMYNLAHSAGAKVLAVTPPSHNFYVNRTENKLALQQQLAQWIKNNPAKDYFIDFGTISNNQSYFSATDGYQHAQAPAHKILAQNVAQQLKLS